MKVQAFAKVNLALDILGHRTDGLHAMDMVMGRVNLFDTLEIFPADQDEILCSSLTLPKDNTLRRALEALRKRGLKNHYRIVLTKAIPAQSGLGGASADAAALLKALNEEEQLNLSLEELEKAGFEVGADVPFCLHSGYARVSGAGEKVCDLPGEWKIPVVLVQGVQGISTVKAFQNYEAHPGRAVDVDIVSDAVRKKDLGLLYQTMENAFEDQAFLEIPELLVMKEDMLEAGLVRVMMTGSGSVLMGFCVDDDVMEEACAQLRKKYPFVWKGWIGA